MQLRALPVHGDEALALVRGDGSASLIDPGDATRTLVDPDPAVTLRERTLNTTTGAKTAEPIGATLVRLDGQRFEVVSDGRGGWTLADGEATEPEPVERLMGWLAEPTVERWVSSDEGPMRPGHIDLHVAGQDVTYRIDPGSGRGSRSDLDGVFRLPPEVVAALDVELRARTVIPLTLKQIDRVEVIDEGGASGGQASGGVLRRLEDGRYDAGTTGLSVERVAQVMDVLAGLRAERFASEPAATPNAADERGGYRIVAASDDVYDLIRTEAGTWRLDGPNGAKRWFTLSDVDASLLASPREAPDAAQRRPLDD